MDHSPRAAIRQVTRSLPQSSLTKWVSAVSPTSDQPSSGGHHSGLLSGRYSPSDTWQRPDVPTGPTSIHERFALNRHKTTKALLGVPCGLPMFAMIPHPEVLLLTVRVRAVCLAPRNLVGSCPFWPSA